VLRAFEQAASQGIRTVALTGADGGALAPLASVAIRVPSSETSHIQEIHLALEHALAFLVEETLYPRG
jgi:phosphoheptose isomerase